MEVIMETLEETQLEVQQELYQLDADNLRKICGSLPEIQDFDEKTKRQLIRLILNHLESDEVAELEDGGMATLLSLQDQINEMLKPAKEEEKSDNEEEKKQELTYTSSYFVFIQIQPNVKPGPVTFLVGKFVSYSSISNLLQNL